MQPASPAKTNVSSFLDAFRARAGSLDRFKLGLARRKHKQVPSAIPEQAPPNHVGMPLVFTQSTGSLPNITPRAVNPHLSPHLTAVILHPILKRTEPTNNNSNGYSSAAQSSPKKKAHFKNMVDIYHHDNHENKLVCKQSEELKKEYPYIVCDRLTDCQEGGDSDVISIRHIFKSDQMTVVRALGGKKRLRLVIHMGRDFMREKVSVRALKGGQRLVVVGHKHEPLGDGSTFLRQYTDKFVLPYTIDPYTLRASLDHGGNLTIEAPVKDMLPVTPRMRRDRLEVDSGLDSGSVSPASSSPEPGDGDGYHYP